MSSSRWYAKDHRLSHQCRSCSKSPVEAARRPLSLLWPGPGATKPSLPVPRCSRLPSTIFSGIQSKYQICPGISVLTCLTWWFQIVLSFCILICLTKFCRFSSFFVPYDLELGTCHHFGICLCLAPECLHKFQCFFRAFIAYNGTGCILCQHIDKCSRFIAQNC